MEGQEEDTRDPLSWKMKIGGRDTYDMADTKQRWVLLTLLIAAAFHLVVYFNSFEVPQSDFFAFRRDALAYLGGNLPETFKRGPFFPVLIGLSSALLSVDRPVLLAVEVWNVLFSLGSVYFVYRISLRLLGRTGLLVPLAFVISPLFVPAGVEPLGEPSLVFLIALTVYLGGRNSSWAYLTAFGASLIRYEGALLIPLLVVLDLIGHKKFLQTLAKGFLSSLGIFAWLGLSLAQSHEANPYVSEMTELTPSGLRFLVSTLGASFKFVEPFYNRLLMAFSATQLFWSIGIILTIIFLVLCFLGFWRLTRSVPRLSWMLLGFVIGYLIIHCSYHAVVDRYTYPILWMLYLGLTAGILHVVRHSTEIRNHESTPAQCEGTHWIMNSLVAVPIVAVFAAMLLRSGWHAAFPFLALATVGFQFSRYLLPEKSRLLFAPLAALCITVAAAGGVVTTARCMDVLKTEKIQYKWVAEWLAAHGLGSSTIVVTDPYITGYYAHSPSDKVLGFIDFQSEDCGGFLGELEEREVDFLVWDNAAGARKDAVGIRNYRLDLFRCLFDDDGHLKSEGLQLAAEFSLGRKQAKIYELINTPKTTSFERP